MRTKLFSARKCLLWVASVLAVIASAAAGADVDIDVRRAEGIVVIGARAELKADPATAWRVLTDYARYPEFVPGMRESRVVARRGTHAVVAQSGDAPLWFMRTPVEITYQIQEFPPSRIESSAKADAVRALDSSYQIFPAPEGVRLEYEGRLAPRSAWLGRIEQYALRQAIVAEFQALADRIEQEAAAER
ncbi:MAG TPA: SRPBCC family protein [Casimicrobiaceae bacterium]|nr:SRPBCC family protein [Casimicrobiaceae bacterium]